MFGKLKLGRGGGQPEAKRERAREGERVKRERSKINWQMV